MDKHVVCFKNKIHFQKISEPFILSYNNKFPLILTKVIYFIFNYDKVD